MTLIINYKCDGCGKLEKGFTDSKPPPRWWRLGYKMPDTDLSQGSFITTHHFCSSGCMDEAVSVKKPEGEKE